MTPLAFHHLGVGTPRFDEAIAVYESLGYSLELSVEDAVLDVRVAFLRGLSGPWIEIVSPLGPDGPLKSLLARRALPAPYHTCYATHALDEANEALRGRGFLPVGEPKPARAFSGARIAYNYHPAVGLLELVENPPI